MGLKEIYILSDLIQKSIKKEDLPKEIKENMVIHMQFPPATCYGIDKEFYYMTHNNSYEGFVHSPELVTATVNGIKFNITPLVNEER